MTVGGNPFRIARPSRAQRSALRDWLLRAGAVLGATIFAMGVSSSAWARKSAPLATTVWVANSGALNGGSLETFAAGSKKNSKPQYRNVGQQSLLEFLPIPGGSIVAAVNPAGVALTPDSNHVSVVGQLVFLNSILGPTGAMLTYTPTANGDVPPETIIMGADTGLGLPGGDAYGPSPYLFYNRQQQIILPPNELYVTNTNTVFPGEAGGECLPCASDSPCGTVTEYPEGAGGTSLADPAIDTAPDEVIGGDAAETALAEPVGIKVDTVSAELCYPPADTLAEPPTVPTDYCGGGTLVETIYTRRVWVVNRFLGLVTEYLPDLACALAPSYCPGNSGITGAPTSLAQMPPFAAFFSTTDALPPASDATLPPACGSTTPSPGLCGGDTGVPCSVDSTNPNYIATQIFASACDDLSGGSLTCPEVYVTDLAGGFKGNGRIKFFATIPADVCLATDTTGTYCVFAVRGALFGLPDKTIEGKKTRLAKVMGIAAQPAAIPVASSQSSAITGEPDNLFVTNVDGNSILQFSSLEEGNVRPDAFVRGRRTKMNQPSGLAVTAPQMLISSPGNKQ
jgi:hypothetical protein